MRNFFLISTLLISLALSGCGITALTERYINSDENELLEITAAPTAIPERVYMDEMSGQIQGFDGQNLSILSDEVLYTFNISSATIETSHGLIPGSPVSIIYEGQLTDQNTSVLNVLKVADELNEKETLTEQVYFGRIVQITSDLLILAGEDDRSVMFSIPGCRTSFQSGADTDRWIYVHYLGTLPAQPEDAGTPADARFIRVLSISDTESYQPVETVQTGESLQSYYGSVVSYSDRTLSLQLGGEDTTYTLDISQVPVSAGGGITPGSGITLTAVGERTEETTLAGLSLLSITGDDPDTQKVARISTWLAGTVIGTTADTVTLQTDDGALLIARTSEVSNTSTGEFAYGSRLKVTFHPSQCRDTNILASVKLEDYEY